MAGKPWDEKIRAYKLDPEKGRVVDSFTIREIIKEPNRYQMEAIIQACCKVMQGLIDLDDQRDAALNTTLQSLRGSHEPRSTISP